MTIDELQRLGETRIRRPSYDARAYVRLGTVFVDCFGPLGPNSEHGRVRILRWQLPKDDRWEPYRGVVDEDF
jgi:hypothetical protein